MTKKGFTLIELLVVIAIIGLISSVIFASLKSLRLDTRDSNRVGSLVDFQKGLELYYTNNNHYPSACGVGSYGFSYKTIDKNTGACTGPQPSLRFDNSTSAGFLDELYDLGYITQEKWTDPSNPPEEDHGNPFNCRYVVPCNFPKPPAIPSCLDCKPQYYLLHCKLEKNFELAENDGGGSNTSYELFGGEELLCLKTTP